MLYGAAVVAAVLWEKEPELWETTDGTEVPYTPEPACPPWALRPTAPEQQRRMHSDQTQSGMINDTSGCVGFFFFTLENHPWHHTGQVQVRIGGQSDLFGRIAQQRALPAAYLKRKKRSILAIFGFI